MSYNLNTKKILKRIFLNLIFLVSLFFIYYLIFGSSWKENSDLMLGLSFAGASLLTLLTGGIGIIIIIYLNIKLLIYKNANILILEKNKLLYDSYFTKSVEIKREDVERIYLTKSNNDLYIAILSNHPIKIKKNKNKLLFLLYPLESSGNLLYINISELDVESEKIIKELEGLFSIKIQNKEKFKIKND